MPSWKDAVRAATAGANITLSGTQTVDDVVLAAGDRVLVKDQTVRSQNGIYVVAPGAWARASDADTSALMAPEMVVRVSEGTVNGGVNGGYGGSAWVLVTHNPVTLGTTDLVYARTDLLVSDSDGQLIGFQGTTSADADIFIVSNALQAGQSDNPTAYLAASVAGHSEISTGVCGRHGNGSTVQPDQAMGVYGDSDNGYGIYGSSGGSVGVFGSSTSGDGVHGESNSPGNAGVSGTNSNGGIGVSGYSTENAGIKGESNSFESAGVYGINNHGGIGVIGESQQSEGVHGMSHANLAGVAGYNDSAQGGPGILGSSNAGPAGYFEGNVVVTGDIQLTGGQDCCEQFDVSSEEICTPGTVMTIDDKGALIPCSREYDVRVAGVVAGGGSTRPGLILGEQSDSGARLPISLIGTTFCQVTADRDPIAVGDLLTTSAVTGCAMKAADGSRALGAILGKALQPLTSGSSMIRILIALQ